MKNSPQVNILQCNYVSRYVGPSWILKMKSSLTTTTTSTSSISFSLYFGPNLKKKLISILLQVEPSNGPYTTPTFGQSYLGTVIFTTRAALTDFKDDKKPHEESSILALQSLQGYGCVDA